MDMSPVRAVRLAAAAGLSIEQTYMGLVRLHDMGVAKIILRPHRAGQHTYWEHA